MHDRERNGRSERERMLAGELYDPLDASLMAARERARNLCQAFNASGETDTLVRRKLLVDLTCGWVAAPSSCPVSRWAHAV